MVWIQLQLNVPVPWKLKEQQTRITAKPQRALVIPEEWAAYREMKSKTAKCGAVINSAPSLGERQPGKAEIPRKCISWWQQTKPELAKWCPGKSSNSIFRCPIQAKRIARKNRQGIRVCHLLDTRSGSLRWHSQCTPQHACASTLLRRLQSSLNRPIWVAECASAP